MAIVSVLRSLSLNRALSALLTLMVLLHGTLLAPQLLLLLQAPPVLLLLLLLLQAPLALLLLLVQVLKLVLVLVLVLVQASPLGKPAGAGAGTVLLLAPNLLPLLAAKLAILDLFLVIRLYLVHQNL